MSASVADAESSFTTSAVPGDDDLPLYARMWMLAYQAYELYETQDNLEALEFAVQCFRTAADEIEDNDPQKTRILGNLSMALLTRFNRTGELRNLEEAIVHARTANTLTPEDHPDKPRQVSSLAHIMLTRFNRGGGTKDLQEAVELQNRAVELAPDDHEDKPMFLNNLGQSLLAHFRVARNIDDLEMAVKVQSRAVELTPDGDLHKSVRLTSLGNSLVERFGQLGDLEDLERAIALQHQSLELTPDNHSSMPSRLSDVGGSLLTRFSRLGNVEDLEGAIELFTRATDLTPDDHVDKPAAFGNLSRSLSNRYQQKKDLSDLEVAIAFQVQAVKLTPDGHPTKPGRLTNLGNRMDTLFEQSGRLEVLDEAIKYKTLAVDVTPDDHARKPSSLYNLGISLWQRYDKGDRRDVEILEKAISCGKRSVVLLPDKHPEQAEHFRLLGLCFMSRLALPEAVEADDAIHAETAFLKAMQHTTSHPLEQLRASLLYVELLSQYLPHFTAPPKLTLLEAYKHALDLIPRCMWLGNNVRNRYTSEELQGVRRVVTDSATAAIEAGEYGLALEWLETGRAVVWSQVLQLRTPLDDLRRDHNHLAEQLDHFSQALQLASTSSPTPPISLPVSTGAQNDRLYPPNQAQTYHSYALKYNTLVAQIREIEGFENFLRPKTLSQLKGACVSGPVVAIHVNPLSPRCDALILSQPDKITHVPLPKFSYKRAHELHGQLWSILVMQKRRGRFREAAHDEDDHRGVNIPGRGRRNDPMFGLLADLWNNVVSPILEVISTLPNVISPSTKALPHVTWCPTGPLAFLPLHAAGIYRSGQSLKTVMDSVISSYTPTLEALLRPRTQTNSTELYPRSLVVSQPETPNFPAIPHTTKEARIVKMHIPSTCVLEGSEGTVSAVLDGMEKHDWVHLACHGLQNRDDPTDSFFALHDGHLALSAFISKHISDGDLAVLSACQTATGDAKLPEEAIHLAAGMLNVGYKSVIGTMWSINDKSAPIAMNKFYEVIAEQVRVGGEIRPAYALHEATKALRNSKEVGATNFIEWVPFVHFGL